MVDEVKTVFSMREFITEAGERRLEPLERFSVPSRQSRLTEKFEEIPAVPIMH